MHRNSPPLLPTSFQYVSVFTIASFARTLSTGRLKRISRLPKYAPNATALKNRSTPTRAAQEGTRGSKGKEGKGEKEESAGEDRDRGIRTGG